MSVIFRRWASTFKPERPQEIQQLLKPVGLLSKPLPNADPEVHKTLQQRKEEFLDVKRNRIRREELKQEFARSAFEDIYKFRHTGGKIFTAPPAPFAAEKSLYMINIKGMRLDGSIHTDTSLAHLLSSTMPNLVRIFSSTLGKNQISEFTNDIDLEKNAIQLVDVNVPTSWINRLLVKWFSRSIRKREIGDPKFHNYLLASSKLPDASKKAINAVNELAGYLYVVDKNGKIRWATSGPVIGDEKQQLNRILEELKRE